MKNIVTLTVMAVICLSGYAKVSFEKGYYINNNGQKINCLIKNIDRLRNPTSFKYKLSENSEVQEAAVEAVAEFGVYNHFKFVRKKVNIDRSSSIVTKLDTDRNPKFNEELLFLRVLVEGKAVLYAYIDGNLERYFYDHDGNKIQQLIYKKYRTSDNSIGENQEFRQELWNNLQCQRQEMFNIRGLEYRESDLINYFIKYNKCTGSKVIEYKRKQNRDAFNFNIRPGLSNILLNEYIAFNSEYDFNNELSFRIGAELEYLIPFNQGKWSVIVEPTLRQYKSQINIDANVNPFGDNITVKVDYNAFEFPVGARHYFFLGNSSKIFINALYVVVFDDDSFISERTTNFSRVLKNNSSGNLAFGIGYKYKDKLSFELRMHSNREMEGIAIVGSARNFQLKIASLIFGYTLF